MVLATVAGPRGPADPSDARAERGGGLALREIGRFESPIYAHGPRGAGRRVFVVERQGRIKVLSANRPRGVFLDIRGKVRCCDGERGMFSVAFADYRRSKRFYVYYTDNRGDLRIDRFRIRRRGERPRAVRRSGRKVLEIRHRQAANHNGGQLQFGPDGYLYIATGDGGGGGDPFENAQDRRSLLGKLLRIDPSRRSRGKRYRVPRGNPYRGSRPGRGEIFARGLRNPWRFSFDGRRIVIADVGQNRFEEVNYERLRRARRANFGWDNFEGFARFEGPSLGRHDRPIHVYSHSGGRCSITGGYVVRDPGLPALRGRYLYGDLCAGEIRSLKPRLRGARDDRATGLGRGGLVSFGVDARRNVYVVAGGSVFRLTR